MKVKEAMTALVKVCGANASLDDLARLMWENDCGSIPIVSDDGKPIGIVTDRDITMSAMLNHKPLWEMQASVIIQGQQPCCCSADESVEECLGKMEQHEVRRLMVTDANGALCGILSLGDAVAICSSQTPRWRKNAVSTEPLIEMLRKVSSHHASDAQMAGGVF